MAGKPLSYSAIADRDTFPKSYQIHRKTGDLRSKFSTFNRQTTAPPDTPEECIYAFTRRLQEECEKRAIHAASAAELACTREGGMEACGDQS